MATFIYRARSGTGQDFEGEIEARNLEEARSLLQARGIRILTLNPSAGGKRRSLELNPFAHRSITQIEVERGLHQLAILVRSGMPLLSALRMTAEFERPGARKVWHDLVVRVEAGEPLTEAMEHHRVFNGMTRALVRIGEETGRLDTAFRQAHEQMERRRRLIKEFISSLTYPAFSLLMAIGVAYFMVVSLIPKIKLFVGQSSKLPAITQMMIDASDWIQKSLGGAAVGVGITLALAFFLYLIPAVRIVADRGFLYIPVVGRIIRLSETILFTNALGTMLRSGVRLIGSLEIIEQLHTNRYIRDCTGRMRLSLQEGASLNETLSVLGVYPPLLIRMIAVGEQSGSLGSILEEMTFFYEENLQKLLKQISATLPVISTLLVGGLLGFVYSAYMVAMFSAATDI